MTKINSHWPFIIYYFFFRVQ